MSVLVFTFIGDQAIKKEEVNTQLMAIDFPLKDILSHTIQNILISLKQLNIAMV
jgi:hypothetical protein